MIQCAFLLADFLAYAIFGQWILYSMLLYLLVSMVLPGTSRQPSSITISIIAVLLHDFALHGRVGLVLAFLVPTWLIVSKLKYTIMNAGWILLASSIVLFFFMENMLFYGFVGDHSQPFLVTSMKILINLILGFIIFGGMQGNRALASNMAGGRKVWTPNRMDASQDL